MWSVCALGASAAPTSKKKERAPEPAPAAEAAEESKGDDWIEKPKAPEGKAADPEFGEPPTPSSAEGERPSPLTPPASEMPTRPAFQGADYADLMGKLVALRARVHALTAALYESKLRIQLDADGEETRIASLTVTVDGGVVYVAPERFAGADELVVYEHAVAPGRHVIGIEVERVDPRAKGYRTWQATRYAVDVPEKKTLSARVELEDDSSMDDASSGRYRNRSTLRVEVISP